MCSWKNSQREKDIQIETDSQVHSSWQKKKKKCCQWKSTRSGLWVWVSVGAWWSKCDGVCERKCVYKCVCVMISGDSDQKKKKTATCLPSRCFTKADCCLKLLKDTTTSQRGTRTNSVSKTKTLSSPTTQDRHTFYVLADQKIHTCQS